MEEKKKIINIHLIEVAKMLKADSKMIRNYSLIAGLIGVILAFATPKVYKSTVILAPEESGSSFSGSISSLAAMVGMNNLPRHHGVDRIHRRHVSHHRQEEQDR